MKKISAVLLAVSFLMFASGCSEKTTTETKYASGQKKSEFNYIDGKENGLQTMWFENGQKESEVNYKNGKE